MFSKAVLTRYITYTVGIFTTALNLLMITYFLDVNEFAVWGIATSLIYIFSQIGQLTYVQFIDKYFPQMSLQESKFKVYQFLKTITLFSPIYLSVLFLLDGIGYFDKFLIENIYILFLMLTTLIVLEAAIEVTSKYMLAMQKTQSFDLNEFLLLKLFRSFLFFTFLYNGFSIYHLFFISILLRSIFLISILSKNEISIIVFFKNIAKANIFKNNFEKLRYTTVAFMIKTLQITFLNIIFLIYSNFSESTEIATYSLGILIINNLRPVISSFSSLLTPKISQRANVGNESKNFLILTSFLNTFLSSVFIFGSMFLFLLKDLIQDYFINYEGNVLLIIFLSIIASTLMSIYQPVLLFVKFSDREKELLNKLTFNYSFCLVMFYFFQIFDLNNLILFYILFEILNLYFSQKIYRSSFQNSNVFLVSYGYIVTSILVIYGNIFNFEYIYFYVPLLLISYFLDYKRFKKRNLNLNL